jgi:hypothetical protein
MSCRASSGRLVAKAGHSRRTILLGLESHGPRARVRLCGGDDCRIKRLLQEQPEAASDEASHHPISDLRDRWSIRRATVCVAPGLQCLLDKKTVRDLPNWPGKDQAVFDINLLRDKLGSWGDEEKGSSLTSSAPACSCAAHSASPT